MPAFTNPLREFGQSFVVKSQASILSDNEVITGNCSGWAFFYTGDAIVALFEHCKFMPVLAFYGHIG
jgi:hypothetical protein